MKSILVICLTIISINCFSQLRRKDSTIFVKQSNLLSIDSAKVAIDVTIDSTGETISAAYQPKGSTTTDKKVIEFAKKKALDIRWNRSSDITQSATVVFKFRITN